VDTAEALRPLEVLVGDWVVEAALPMELAPGEQATASFAWELGGTVLVQRSWVPHPVAPDVVCVIAWHEERGSLVQHYFDSRGVVRLYDMAFDGTSWTLRRERPDFSDLAFHQRFEGRLSPEGDRIDGRWETARDGGPWELDFELAYVRG
jgi:hypothetical protein